MPSQHRSIEERVSMFRSYYKQENERPLLGFFLGSEYPVTRYPSMSRLPEHRPLQPEDFPVAEFLADSEHLFRCHEQCGGDFIWSGSAYWGLPWLEAALGCAVFANHSTGSIYSEPPAYLDGTRKIGAFEPGNPWLRLMDTMLMELQARSCGQWPIGTTRMRGISDLLAALYGGSDFVMAMMEDAVGVRHLSAELTEYWLEMARFQLDRIPDFHGGIGSFYYNAWAPRKTVWCQEDAAALLSPTLFDDFIEPGLKRIVDELPRCIMHQHTTGFSPLESYLDMEFLALELHIDEGGPTAEDLFEKHQSILARKPLIIWGDICEKDMDWIFSKLTHRGLAVIAAVDSAEQAKLIWKKYQN